ncbi:MAG TPA: CRTAC1 family protein, partial [Bryobacteraceae bacterium]
MFRKMRRLFAIFALPVLAASIFHADFRDIAAASGLTAKNIFGGAARKDFILETTGNGAAIFDYDGDGRDDIFIANGRQLNS